MLMLSRGALPNRQLKFVLAWAELHNDELMQNWELAAAGKPLNPIDPLMWGGAMEYLPRVVQTVVGDDYTVYAYYSDGSVRLADIKPLIERGGVFSQLADPDYFANRLTVMNGAVAWDVTGNRDETACIDLDPWNMYETSECVADPLAEEAA